MIPGFVLDASVTMAWCFPDEATPAVGELLGRMKTESAAIPPVWYLEITNALAIAQRKRRIQLAQAAAFVVLLESLELQVDDQKPDQTFARLLPICRTHGLTSYDAAYLDLAVRRQLPLASLDDDLRAAASSLGISVLGR